MRERFSVIIPTLQRSPLLEEMLSRYLEHPLVGEVIVINNAPAPLSHTHEKLRVLQQDENIFVNPAWNLGATEAVFPLLAIANDDLSFDLQILDKASDWLSTRAWGMIGPHENCFDPRTPIGSRLRPTFLRDSGFGTLMMMRKENYVSIPENLLVWFGDDFLFNSQKLRNATFSGLFIETPMSVSSGDAAFNPLRDSDAANYVQNVPDTLRRSFPSRRFVAERARAVRDRYRRLRRLARRIVKG